MFEVGNVVKLNSGSPKLSVEKVVVNSKTKETTLIVQWFDNHDYPQTMSADARCFALFVK
jgi:uncharacterized protein YodC (DUF2158 family)